MSEPEDALMPVPLEDLSRFVSDRPIGPAPEALAKLFQDGPEITISGTFNDAANPPEPCDCEDCLILRTWIGWRGWARAHRN